MKVLVACEYSGRVRDAFIALGHAGTAGAPSVLIAYGADNADALRTSGIPGYFIALANIAQAEMQPCLDLEAA